MHNLQIMTPKDGLRQMEVLCVCVCVCVWGGGGGGGLCMYIL